MASTQSRALGYLIDRCAPALVFIPTAFASYMLETPSVGAWEFSAVFFVYQVCFLYLREGCSLGKYIRHITAVRMDGSRLHVVQSLLRAALLALPWALVGASDLSGRPSNELCPRQDSHSLVVGTLFDASAK